MTLWSFLVAENPDCGICHGNMSRLMVYTAPEEALAEAELALKLASQPWHISYAHLMRASALAKLGRVEEAIETLVLAEKSELVDRSRETYALNRAKMLIRLNRLDEANQVIDQVAKSETRGGAQLFLLRGHLAIARDRPDLARIHFHNGTIGDRPAARAKYLRLTNDPALWRRLGDAMAAAGETAKAAAAHAEAEQLAKAAAQAPQPAADQPDGP